MLKLRNIELGSGVPKIIVPLTGADVSEVRTAADIVLHAQPDIVEWRADFLEPLDETQLLACLHELRLSLGKIPLLFTLRSAAQGGQAALSEEDYFAYACAAAVSGDIDMLDIELESESASKLVTLARETQVASLVSYHDMRSTPVFDMLYDIYQREYELGADVCKLAVTAVEEGDELRLMAATNQFASDNKDAYLIGISMGELGSITRIAGEFFGSCATFCSAVSTTAPGQLDIATARSIIAQLHEEGYNL